MDDDRMDLGPLDPWPDAVRLDAAVARAVSRGIQMRAAARRTPTLADLLAAWRRPALVLAAALALVAVPVLLLVESKAPDGRDARSSAALAVVDWAWDGPVQPLELMEAAGR